VGQKKIQTIDLSQENSAGKADKKDKGKKPTKKTKKRIDKGADKEKKGLKTEKIKLTDEDKSKKAEKEIKEEKMAVKKQPKMRSKRYKKLKTQIDQNKLYQPEEALDLLLKIANSKIDETAELHLQVKEEKLTGQVNLPHGTGKKQKIAIANNTLISQIEKGKINFDVLIATPKMMPKIAKVAKILGPKGLMPNPKAGTITVKPESLKKKLEAGEIRFKTETKAPLIHLILGKVSFGKKKLWENLKAYIKAVKARKISKAVLTSTHSPGIKLDLTNYKS
jgi:large subunit ribosomal protein L1